LFHFHERLPALVGRHRVATQLLQLLHRLTRFVLDELRQFAQAVDFQLQIGDVGQQQMLLGVWLMSHLGIVHRLNPSIRNISPVATGPRRSM
jgi:hypothetical protein